MGKSTISSKIVEPSTYPQSVFKAKAKNTKRKQQKKELTETKKTRVRWQQDETNKYCQFIQDNEKILSMPQKKDKQKIFNKMQQCVVTRTKEQCKSHHQKMLKRYKSISKILQNHLKIIKEIQIKYQDVDDHVQKQTTSIGTYCNLETQQLKETDMIEQKFHDRSQNKNMISEDSVSQNDELLKSYTPQNQIQDIDKYLALS